MKRHFKFELKIKGVDKVFREGMAPGVFISHVASFPTKGTEHDRTSSLFIGSLLQHSDDFLKENVEVIMTECDEEGSPLNGKEIEGRASRPVDGKGSG